MTLILFIRAGGRGREGGAQRAIKQHLIVGEPGGTLNSFKCLVCGVAHTHTYTLISNRHVQLNAENCVCVRDQRVSCVRVITALYFVEGGEGDFFFFKRGRLFVFVERAWLFTLPYYLVDGKQKMKYDYKDFLHNMALSLLL